MSKMVVVDEKEFRRAFDECLAKIAAAFLDTVPPHDPNRMVNYHIVQLRDRLENG